MDTALHSKSRFSLSAVLALGFPAALIALLLVLELGMRSGVNPVDAGVVLLLGASVCPLGGLVASVIAFAGGDRPRWAGITGLVVNGLVIVYVVASLLLSA